MQTAGAAGSPVKYSINKVKEAVAVKTLTREKVFVGDSDPDPINGF